MSRLLLCATVISAILPAVGKDQQATPKTDDGRSVLVETLDRIRPSIIQIRLSVDGAAPALAAARGQSSFSQPFGTAFFVNRAGYAITARHVITVATAALTNIQARSKKLKAGVAMANYEYQNEHTHIVASGNFVVFDFDVVDEDQLHDLALLKLRPNPFAPGIPLPIAVSGQESVRVEQLTIDSRRPKEGSAIAISGYPFGEPVLITNAGVLSSAWSVNVPQPQPGEALRWLEPTAFDSYLADLVTNPGNSGGPVYSVHSGALIGVCLGAVISAGTTQTGQPIQVLTPTGQPTLVFHPVGMTQLAPAHFVTALLKKHGLEWSELAAK